MALDQSKVGQVVAERHDTVPGAVAIAWSPATPAPITKTFDGISEPAAVVSMGNSFADSLAATRTDL